MKKKFVKKLDEDDVLEILIEHFQRGKQKKIVGNARFFGSAGQDLRVVIVLNDNESENFDLEEIDRNTDFNGDHSFLNNHPEFDLSKHLKKEDNSNS